MPGQALVSIVDDDESVRIAAMDQIKSMGFVARAFPSAEDFLRSSYVHDTSCLIADMRMPGMTGLGLHNHLAINRITIPTIIVTAYPDDEDRARALQSGVLCYLAKPFNDADLFVCVRAALDSREAD